MNMLFLKYSRRPSGPSGKAFASVCVGRQVDAGTLMKAHRGVTARDITNALLVSSVAAAGKVGAA